MDSQELHAYMRVHCWNASYLIMQFGWNVPTSKPLRVTSINAKIILDNNELQKNSMQ